jgi:uncharacterized BrkB/YihY/UPF0761 family membrane protein
MRGLQESAFLREWEEGLILSMRPKRKFKHVFLGFIFGVILGVLLVLRDGYTFSRLLGYGLFYGVVGIVIALFPFFVNILH